MTVLDISLDTNRTALLALVQHGVEVEYFDHHFSGAIPENPDLKTYIDTTPEICTSLIVDRHVGGQHRLWAIVGAYGDNLLHAARTLAGTCRLQPGQVEQLRELGESINYNAYGESESDLLIPPTRLYKMLHAYADPFHFATNEPIVQALRDARRHDMELALGRLPVLFSRADQCMCCPMRDGLEGCGEFSPTFWRECYLIVPMPSLPWVFRATTR